MLLLSFSISFFSFLIWNEYIICCLKLIYCVIYKQFCSITFFHLSESLISPLFKIIEVYLQNTSRDTFLFRLWIEIVYHGRNFLMSNNNRIEQNQENTEENVVERSNQTVTAFLLQPMHTRFCMSWWKTMPRRFANSGRFFSIAVLNLSSWLQYLTELMVSPWGRSS